MKNANFNRRTFLTRIAMGAAVIASQQILSACGSGSSGTAAALTPTTGGNCDTNGSALETTGVTDGHSHTIQITAAEIAAANPNAVFTTSSAGHTHPVQLTAIQYASLQANTSVSLSTEDGGAGHTHTLVIGCA